MKYFTYSFLLALALTSFPVTTEAVIVEPGFEKELVATGFALPVAMTFASGDIFVAEKGGTVRLIHDGVVVTTPVISLTDINSFGDRGLLGIAADPNFATNGYLYLSYTYENTPGTDIGGEKTGRIVRVTVVNGVASESSKVVLVGSHGGSVLAPSCDDVAVTLDCIPSDSGSHSVGGLRFGPDGKLYATLGDGANFDYADPKSLRAQNIDSLAGKVLRINSDGSAPSDNPFFNNDAQANRSKVYALGVRNSFRLNFHPTTGQLFASDVGWSEWEEINTITSGSNYGWPCWEGLTATTHSCAAANTAPTYYYAHNSFGAGSVTAGAFPGFGAYPVEYNNDLFVGDYAQNWIKRLRLNESGELISIHDFMDDPDGPVDISMGPDGTIYYLSIYTGELNRITHTTGNRKPVVTIAATPTAGLLPLPVIFSSVGTYDPDADALTYAWNFGDGATSNLANPSHTYTENGAYTATLTVTDSFGASASANSSVTAGNQAPSAVITAPATGTLYTPGDVIQLQGLGTDLENGTLPASAFHWRVILHHNTHIHVEQEFIGTKSPWFIAPDHTASDVYTEIELTVTDDAGLTSTVSINLYLNNGTGAGNLIQNPSVEVPQDGISGNPLNWIRGNYGLNNPVFTYPVAGIDGSKALQVSMDFYVDGSAKWYFSPIAVTPGDEYLYSNMYTGTVPTTAFAQLGLSNGTYQYQYLGSAPATSIPTNFSATLIIPAGVETLTIWHQLDSVGTLTTDAFSLTLQNGNIDTTAPALTMTSPSDGSSLSGTTTISVSAADASGVAGVQLIIDGVDFGVEDIVAPYEFHFDSNYVPEGAHHISARARDTVGNAATSTSITLSTVTFASNLILNADFEIENGAVPLGWNHGGWGNHTRAYSYPIVGHDGNRAARTDITAYPPTPTGSGDAKWVFTKVPVTPGTQYTYSDYYRSNTISDVIGQYTLNDGSFHYFGLAKEIAPTATWAHLSNTFTPPVNATHVTFFHIISSVGFVEIDDVALYKGSTSTPSETNVPTVEFTNPLVGQTISGTTTLTASSTDDTAVTYVFYAVDGIPITGQISAPPYSFDWDSTTVANGPHTFKVTTHDPFGNNSTDTISVNVYNSAPSPTTGNLILNPSLENPDTGGNPEFWHRGGWGTNTRTFTYPTTGVHGAKAARVEISTYTSGDAKWYFTDVPVTPLTSYNFTHQYTSTIPTEMLVRYTLQNGSQHYQYLGARSATSGWATSTYTILPPENTVSLTVLHVIHAVGSLEVDNFSLTSVDTQLPTVTISSPIDLTTVSGVVSLVANATDDNGIASVQFVVNGTSVGPEILSAPYSIDWDTSMIANGTHSITAVVRDIAGNSATSTPSIVTVQNTVALTSLIQNPSFEIATGVQPANWISARWGANTTIFTYPIAGTHGASGARIEMSSYTDGDAKWRHDDVAVTPGGVYTLGHDYRSNVLTNITARYTMLNGSYQYVSLGNYPASANWTSITQTFVAPSGATSVTIFHILNAVGFLETDRFALIAGNANQFTNGMISLTFDDGWVSQYTTAVPILNAAAVKGTFYITSQETLNAVPNELIHNPSLETVDLADEGYPERWHPGGWGTNDRVFTYPIAGETGVGARVEMTSYASGDAKWWHEDVAVIPGQVYRFEDSYMSNTGTEAILRITLADDTIQYMYLQALPSTDGSWQRFSRDVALPANARLVSLFHILGSVGYLTIDNVSVKRVPSFLNVAQMLEMQAAGHEIGGHTQTHANLTTITTTEAQAEIVGSHTDLLGVGITNPNVFAYPFGAYNLDVQLMTETTGYISARGVERGYNTKATDKYALKIQSMNRTTTIEELQSWVNQAVLDKTWLVLMFHQIDNDLTASLGITPEFLQQSIQTIQTSGIEVISVEEGVSRMNP